MEQKRSVYLDFLRVAACVLVVCGHVSASFIQEIPVEELNFKIMNTFDCFAVLGVPVFVMISGALMLSERYEENIRKLYGKKLLRLAVLYIFWLLFYNTITFIEGGVALNFENVKQEILLDTLLGKGVYHLWFLPMLISLYFITPFIRAFTADLKKCLLFLGLYFFFGILIPTALLFEFPYRTIVASLYDRFDNYLFMGYLGYYVLGHVLHEFLPRLKGKFLLGIAAVGLLSFGIEVYVCNLYSERGGELSTILNNPLLLTAFLSTTALFILAKHLTYRRERFWKWLGRYTLGIYLLHPFLLGLGVKFGWTTLFAPAIIAIPLSVVLMTVLTFIPVYLISKIPGVRKLI